MRPPTSSETYSAPSGPTATPAGRCAARSGSLTAPAKLGEHHAPLRGAPRRERLEHDVVTALRIGRAVPRSVEGDEGPVAVALGETSARVDHHIIRCPVGRKARD